MDRLSYADVMVRVGEAAERAGRQPGEITVVAVSKTKTPAEVMQVYEAGHRDFGENRAREMVSKVGRLPDDIRWHYVGALQSNKASLVRPHTHLLHSMDRRSLANSWLKGSGLAPPVLVQVNIGDEEQKSGVDPEQVGETIRWLEEMGLEVRGLMTLPPAPEEPEDSRPHFAEMRRIRDEVAVDHPAVLDLSMGMTDDFEVAVEEGASIIRVGRAIFGPRT